MVKLRTFLVRISKDQAGSLLLEVIAALGLGIVVVAAISQLGTRALRDTSLSAKQAQITRFTEQGVEAVRSIRDQNIKNAIIDTSCSLVINNPPDPTADVSYCNEWVDVWKKSYSSSRDFRLIPPGTSKGAGDTPVSYWRLDDTNVPETLTGGITRKVTIAETPANDYLRIKKITVRSSFVDGDRTYVSSQDTYLRKL